MPGTPSSSLFPYTTLFRSFEIAAGVEDDERADAGDQRCEQQPQAIEIERQRQSERRRPRQRDQAACSKKDRKSTRLNSSHGYISYAVFCLKKKTTLESPTN